MTYVVKVTNQILVSPSRVDLIVYLDGLTDHFRSGRTEQRGAECREGDHVLSGGRGSSDGDLTLLLFPLLLLLLLLPLLPFTTATLEESQACYEGHRRCCQLAYIRRDLACFTMQLLRVQHICSSTQSCC